MLRVVKLPAVGALAAPEPESELLLVRRHARRLGLQASALLCGLS